MIDLSDFDRFREQRGVAADDEEAVAALFADWLAQQTGQAIVGRPLDGPPIVVAIPDEALDHAEDEADTQA